MFNLIIIVLALVVLLAAPIAGLSYLGPAFTTARAHADGAALVDAGQHFAGAEALYAAQSGGGYLLDGSPGDAMAAFVADGVLQAVPAVPSDLRATTPFSVSGQPDASVHPYLSLGLDPASDMTRRTCAYLDGLGNSQFGCASDLATMAPYPPADGSTSASASFWFMRNLPTAVPKPSTLAVALIPIQNGYPSSYSTQVPLFRFYQASGGTPPYSHRLVGAPPRPSSTPSPSSSRRSRATPAPASTTSSARPAGPTTSR